MVMYRKPVELSKNIEDRRTSARGTAIALAARDAEVRRQKAAFEHLLRRLQEQHQRELRRQQSRGR